MFCYVVAWWLVVNSVSALESIQQQSMPDSFYDGTNVNIKKYWDNVRKVQSTSNPNQHIPEPSPTKLRVMTYNIYMQQNAFKQNNLMELDQIIHTTKPDVIFMQEVLEGSDREMSPFSNMLERNGYGTWHFAQHTSKAQCLGNMVAVKDNIKVNDRYRVDLPEPFYIRSGRHILSKEEELDCPTPGFKSGRTASHVTIMLEDNTTKLHLLSTHLGCEWTNENRMEQARFLLNRVIELADETFILGGDFNAWPNATEVQLFTRSDVGRNVFDDLRWELPKYTCWVGTPVDYIFAGRALHGKVSGAYVYYTLASDHLPLIADFDISIARFF